LKRNWAFVSPRASKSAVADVVDWIRSRRKQQIDRIFLLGHNSGAEVALSSSGFSPSPKAIAAFAPTIRRLPPNLEGVPIFIAVGKQDDLVADLKEVAQQLASRKNSRYAEIDACDHVMIVGESIAEAYRFFDAQAVGKL
jgi:predicted esterase